MARIFSLLVLLFASLVAADLTCDRWVPFLHHSNVGVINFYGINNYSYVPSGNLSVGNPVQLDFVSPIGKRFHFQECNSTSLNLTGQLRVNGQCPDLCAQQFNKFIRVINPDSGHCLTARNLTAHLGEAYFSVCNPDPVDSSQIWQVEQDVELYTRNGKTRVTSAPLYFMTPLSNPLGFQYEPGDYSPWIVKNGSNTLYYRSPDSQDSVSSYIYITG